MLRCTVVVSAICSFAFSAAADSGVAALASPGDCAQPSADYETPPLYQQPAGVSGAAAEHFTPRVDTGVLGVVPVGLTTTRTGATLVGAVSGTADVVDGVTETTVDAASGAVEGVADAVGGAADAIGGAADTLGGAGDAIGGTADAIGGTADAIGSGLGGGATGAVDAVGAGDLGSFTEGTTDALGGGGLTGSTLTGATGAVDTLTDTATGTTSGVLGALK
jgi:hypothetical protein